MAGRLQDALEETYRTQLRAALTACGGDRRATAQFLGVSLRWLHRLLDDYPEIRHEFPVSPGPSRKATARP